jgi:hypothetical protein
MITALMFAGGDQNYKNALVRLYNQAKYLELFDTILSYIDDDLIKDTEFWNKHSNFIMSNKRGFGYWLWKPYLILKTLNQMKDNDILIYLDIGCEIDIRKKSKILELIKKVDDDLIIGSFTHNDKDWTKFDLVERLEIKDHSLLITPQHQASCIMIKKCQQTLDLVKEWYEISYENNYHYIDDSKSIKPNLIGFKEHRHDQSIFSLLTKKHNIYSKLTIEEVINIYRNRTGKSNMKGHFININDKKIYDTCYIFPLTNIKSKNIF